MFQDRRHLMSSNPLAFFVAFRRNVSGPRCKLKLPTVSYPFARLNDPCSSSVVLLGIIRVALASRSPASSRGIQPRLRANLVLHTTMLQFLRNLVIASKDWCRKAPRVGFQSQSFDSKPRTGRTAPVSSEAVWGSG